MTGTPPISVLIPCHNAAPFVAEALESVLAQDWPDLEVIVVDDGSTDGTAEILGPYRQRGVQVIRQSRGGAPAARNAALARARGEWCIFLDADDALGPGYVAAQAAAGAADDADIVLGSFVMTWPDGRQQVRQPVPRGASIDHTLASVLTEGWYPPNSILWRTRFLRAVGGWDATLRRNQDGELLARALLARPRFTSNFESHAVYRQHGGSQRVSARADEAALADSLRIGRRIADALEVAGDFREAGPALALSMYELAAAAHDRGYTSLGREAERLARGHGPFRPDGAPLRRLGTQLLGIEGRARLARVWRRLRRGRLPRSPAA